MATTVSIGRNIPKHASGREAPMSSVSWQRFQFDTLAAIRTYCTDVYFVGHGAGIWTNREESFTFVSSDPEDSDIPNMMDAIGQVGRKYHQEAIAVTLGKTVFV